MDEALNALTREQLLEEVKRLRAGIRAHRDSSEHELCWPHPALWRLLPEPLDPRIAVPAWPLAGIAAAWPVARTPAGRASPAPSPRSSCS